MIFAAPPHPPVAAAPGPSLSRNAGEELHPIGTVVPLSRTAGEGAERSEAGEGA